MKLNELTTTYEKRRVIEFGSSGNEAVRHYVNVRQVSDVLWMSEPQADKWNDEFFDLYIFFPGVPDGGLFRHRLRDPSLYDAEKLYQGLVESGLDTPERFVSYCDKRMKNGEFINNAVISFVCQWNLERAIVYTKYRLDWYEKKHEQERIEEEKRRRQEEIAEAEAKRIRDEEEAKERAKYFGYADRMTAMQFARFHKFMEKLTNTKEHGVQTNRDFVISFLRDGWLPRIDQWGSASKPKTEYRLYLDGGHTYSFKVSKTEYAFAIYLSEHPDYLKSGKEN